KFSQSIDCVSKKPSHALPEFKTINESCRRMDARKVDVLLLTGSKGLLCGILTHQDITTRVVSCELDIENNPISAVMTKNPVFVTSDTHGVKAFQKVVPGKFRYLTVVEDEDVVVIAERLSEKDIGGLKQMFKMIDAGNNGTMKPRNCLIRIRGLYTYSFVAGTNYVSAWAMLECTRLKGDLADVDYKLEKEGHMEDEIVQDQ
ncbi:CBS domain-containing protein CBSCBSPB1, partial [Tanacetum coccineum]